jgi:hypothetical protein
MTESEAAKLVFDVRRTLILGAYMRHWGMPEYRWISRRENHAIEVYSFPPGKDEAVHRFATVGVSAVNREDEKPANYELCMILPHELGGASADEVVSFMLDVAVYSYRKDVRCSVGETIPETPLMPEQWRPKALLFDELRGEPDELSHRGLRHLISWIRSQNGVLLIRDVRLSFQRMTKSRSMHKSNRSGDVETSPLRFAF